MEFQWHLNWWYRPTQLDGFGTSVAEYYDCFCDWKANMELNSCPADEPDYVNAFIQNLKSDIRLRLESKGRTRMRRLGDVFSDAKYEECLISLEEFVKKFEARNLFDERPKRVSADSQAFLDEELSGLQDELIADNSLDEWGTSIADEMSVQIDSEKETHKLFDELTVPIFGASPSTDQVLGKDFHNSSIADETIIEVSGYEDELLELGKGGYGGQQSSPLVLVVAGDVYIDNSSEEKKEYAENAAEASGMVHNSNEVIFMGSKSISGQSHLFSTFRKGELSSCRAVAQSVQPYPSKDGMVEVVYEVFDKGSKRISIKTVCLTAGLNVLDVMSKPYSSDYQLVEEYYEPAFIELVKINEKQLGEVVVFMFDPGIRSCVLNGCASINSSDMSSHSNVELLLGNVLLVFDPGGRLSKLSILLPPTHSDTLDSVTRHEPYERAVLCSEVYIYGFFVVLKLKVDSCNPTLATLAEHNGDTGSPMRMLGCALIGSKGVKQYWDKMPTTAIDELCIGKVFLFIFDPGGSALYYSGCELLWPNNAQQTCAFCDFWVDEWTNTEVKICWTDPCSHNENNLVNSTFGEFKNGNCPANHGAGSRSKSFLVQFSFSLSHAQLVLFW